MPFPAVIVWRCWTTSREIMHPLEQKGNYSDRLLTLAGGKNKPFKFYLHCTVHQSLQSGLKCSPHDPSIINVIQLFNKPVSINMNLIGWYLPAEDGSWLVRIQIHHCAQKDKCAAHPATNKAAGWNYNWGQNKFWVCPGSKPKTLHLHHLRTWSEGRVPWVTWTWHQRHQDTTRAQEAHTYYKGPAHTHLRKLQTWMSTQPRCSLLGLPIAMPSSLILHLLAVTLWN